MDWRTSALNRRRNRLRLSHRRTEIQRKRDGSSKTQDQRARRQRNPQLSRPRLSAERHRSATPGTRHSTMKKTKSTPRATPRRCAVSTGSASDLAAKLARAVFACGDDSRGKCRRIQFKIGEYPNDEISGGGLCEVALADVLRRSMPNIADEQRRGHDNAH